MSKRGQAEVSEKGQGVDPSLAASADSREYWHDTAEARCNMEPLPTLVSRSLSRELSNELGNLKIASADFGVQSETHAYVLPSSVRPREQLNWTNPSFAAQVRAATLLALQCSSEHCDDKDAIPLTKEDTERSFVNV